MASALLRRRLAEIEAESIEQKTVFAQKLAALDREKADIQRQLNSTAFFPVTTLPVEITTEIFLLCLPSIDDLRNNRQHISATMKSHAPTVFLGVCRDWRDIALATPSLWSCLYLRLDLIHKNIAERPGVFEDFIAQWFGRAANRPLSVAFHHRRYQEDASTFSDWHLAPSRLRDVIHKYAPRFEYLELDFGQADLRSMQLETVSFPRLLCAAIGDQYGPDPDRFNPVEVFSNAPILNDLRCITDSVLSYYSPPLSQLTKFDGEIDTMQLFAQAPNLIEVTCSVVYLDPPPTSMISHPNLQSLTLVPSIHEQKPLDILQHLTLPALQSLRISDMEDLTYPALDSFLDRSQPPLRTLSIRADDEDFDWETVSGLVSETLENLEVIFPPLHVQSAILRPMSSVFALPFPRLQTLTLRTRAGISYDDLIRFLDIRTSLPELATLRSFHLHCSPGAFMEDLMWANSSLDRKQHLTLDIKTHLARFASNRGVDVRIGGDKTYIDFRSG
ncbi:F-box domain-containing protein [Favolaschia claudopus]|uniref:F-box domain-containing protein n=1 Tax=Favolaschia claudopus TaxID=2862362 RepID=A0AAW0EB95_9AGAR